MDISVLYQLFTSSTGVTTDTRKILGGEIFFALKGDRFNGNQYAEFALSNGCAFAVIDETEYHTEDDRLIVVNDVLETLQNLARHHRSHIQARVIGLTGSNGKTTSKELMRDVLSRRFRTYATKGNLNNHIGVPLSILEITEEHEFAVIEMGANAQGEIAFLCTISDPDFGFITNIGKAHLEGFGGPEGVKKGKKELFDYLREKRRKVFVNATDPILLSISEGTERKLYGTEVHGPDVYLIKKHPTISYGWSSEFYSSEEVQTQLAGDYNLGNIAIAVAVGLYFGVPADDINKAISNYQPSNNRSERRQGRHNTLIMDAYNANPTSMTNALRSFAESGDDQKLCILGDMFEMGDAALIEHQNIIQLAEELKLETWFVGGLFTSAGAGNTHSHFFKTTASVLEQLKKHPLKNRTILLKGSRGMQLEQLVDLL